MRGYCTAQARHGVRLMRPTAQRPKLVASFLKVLPYLLFVTYCLCTGVSAGIFSAWATVSFVDGFDADGRLRSRSFLHDDPSVEVGTPEHRQVKSSQVKSVIQSVSQPSVL